MSDSSKNPTVLGVGDIRELAQATRNSVARVVTSNGSSHGNSEEGNTTIESSHAVDNFDISTEKSTCYSLSHESDMDRASSSDTTTNVLVNRLASEYAVEATNTPPLDDDVDIETTHRSLDDNAPNLGSLRWAPQSNPRWATSELSRSQSSDTMATVNLSEDLEIGNRSESTSNRGDSGEGDEPSETTHDGASSKVALSAQWVRLIQFLIRGVGVPMVILVTGTYLVAVLLFIIIPTLIFLIASVTINYCCYGYDNERSAIVHGIFGFDIDLSNAENADDPMKQRRTAEDIRGALIQRTCTGITRHSDNVDSTDPAEKPSVDVERQVTTDESADFSFTDEKYMYTCSKALDITELSVACSKSVKIAHPSDSSWHSATMSETKLEGNEKGDHSIDDETETEGSSVSARASVCAICLGRYKVGDVLAFSHNPQCHHVFHLKCITEWIQASPCSKRPTGKCHTAHGCPTCRRDFLYDEIRKHQEEMKQSQERGGLVFALPTPPPAVLGDVTSL